MKSELKLKSGKIINLPSRMFRNKDLSEMNLDYVENKIYFNKYDEKKGFISFNKEVEKNMAIINYVDCSTTPFSKEELVSSIKKQIDTNSDFIILPYFKDENEYDLNIKIELAGKIKTRYNKEIILEISYKATPQMIKKVIKQSENFDILAVFYGVHYGRFPSFRLLCEKIFLFKQVTNGKVFCTGVPLVFSGDEYSKYSYLFPIWSLVCDGWVKNWKRGGGAKEIRLVDYEDYRNKNFMGWCETHKPNDIVESVNMSVKGLFGDGHAMKQVREQYIGMLRDEVLNEVYSITPKSIGTYLRDKPRIYIALILDLYKQKLIIQKVREANWAKTYAENDIRLLEKELFNFLSPSEIEEKIEKNIVTLVSKEQKVPISVLINEVQNSRF
ncbi:MAG: hypothetical protein KAS87_05365 [Candidatus Omnitrophica bacterium]|nr:hypothetical protein [Candidatus Omnitrophota bacterium]